MERANPAPERNCRIRQRRRQYLQQVRRNVVLPRVEQILQMQSRFRFSFHCQPALEEQRVRILPPRGERDEIRQRTAQRDVGCTRRACQPVLDDLEGQGDRNIVRAQSEALAAQFTEPGTERLATQHLIHGERQQALVPARGRESQPRLERSDRMKHENLRFGTTCHSCHERQRTNLISLNQDCA